MHGKRAENFACLYPDPVDVTRKPFAASLFGAVEGLEPKSSPGALCPFPDNSRALEMRHNEIVSQAVMLFDYLIQNDITSWNAERIFRSFGICYKVFIKDELHNLEKTQSGRFRLIFSNPIVLNILERWVFGPTLEREKADKAHFRLPTSVGLVMAGPDRREECFRFKDKTFSFCGNRQAHTDVSGWDWSMTSYLYMLSQARYARSSPEFRRLTTNLLHIAMNKTVMFSDGSIYAQESPGIVPSGSFQTGSLNSYLRSLLRYLIDETLSCTMGDDCVESYRSDLVKLYAHYGVRLKWDGKLASPMDIEFCSKHWREGKIVPCRESVKKMILRMWKTKDVQVRESILMELVDAEDFTDLIAAFGSISEDGVVHVNDLPDPSDLEDDGVQEDWSLSLSG